MGIAVLLPGHRGYPHPSMGAKWGGLLEGDLNVAYLAHTHYALLERGHEVHTPTRAGDLAAMAAEVAALARSNPGAKVAVILGHVNAAGPEHDYSAHLWHVDRSNDRELCDCLATEFGYSPIARSVCTPAVSGDGWTARPFSILRPFALMPSNVSIAVFEPCFMTNEAHRAQMLGRDGLKRIGLGLADALCVWFGG
jgi:hypothetical protein